MVFFKKKVDTISVSVNTAKAADVMISGGGAAQNAVVPSPVKLDPMPNVLNVPVTVAPPSAPVLDTRPVSPSNLKWNNPLNIRVSNNAWLGKVPESKRTQKAFEEFETLDYGTRAAVKNLLTYYSRGLDTVSKIVSTWAPSTENDTASYVNYVASKMSVSKFDVLNLKDKGTMSALVSAMSVKEQGLSKSLTKDYVLQVINKFSLI